MPDFNEPMASTGDPLDAIIANYSSGSKPEACPTASRCCAARFRRMVKGKLES